MVTQDGLWWGAGIALAVAAVAAVAEHRRVRRRDLDRVGWIPWNSIQIFAVFITAILAALAIKL